MRKSYQMKKIIANQIKGDKVEAERKNKIEQRRKTVQHQQQQHESKLASQFQVSNRKHDLCEHQFIDVVEGQTYRRAKDAESKFCLGKRYQQQHTANHICNHIHVYEQD